MSQHAIPTRRTYPANAVIMEEDEAGQHLYIIKRGLVRVYKNGQNGQIPICELGPGNMFGEMTLIDSKSRSASVLAVEETVCLELSHHQIAGLLERANPWLLTILRIMVIRLRQSNEALVRERSPKDASAVTEDKVSERHLRKISRELDTNGSLE